MSATARPRKALRTLTTKPAPQRLDQVITSTRRLISLKQLPDGRYLLDFNSAYNPACAFSDHYNCPIPQRENVLPVAIRAGEMDAHYH